MTNLEVARACRDARTIHSPPSLARLRRQLLARWPDDGDARTLEAVIETKIRRLTRES